MKGVEDTPVEVIGLDPRERRSPVHDKRGERVVARDLTVPEVARAPEGGRDRDPASAVPSEQELVRILLAETHDERRHRSR